MKRRQEIDFKIQIANLTRDQICLFFVLSNIDVYKWYNYLNKPHNRNEMITLTGWMEILKYFLLYNLYMIVCLLFAFSLILWYSWPYSTKKDILLIFGSWTSRKQLLVLLKRLKRANLNGNISPPAFASPVLSLGYRTDFRTGNELA